MAVMAAGASSVSSAAVAASAGAMSLHTRILIGDWAGWFGSNVLIAALAPVLVTAIIKLTIHLGKLQANVAYFDAYRGGALGFIALGWIAGAAAELIKAAAGGPELWQFLWLLVVFLVALVAAISAGIGSLPLAASTTTAATPATGPTQKEILAFWIATSVCVVALSVAALVHYLTSS